MQITRMNFVITVSSKETVLLQPINIKEEVMRIKKGLALALLICLALVLGYAGAAPASDTAKTEAEADWKFHTVVDVDFVMSQIQVPMPEDVMVIDARPKRAKYDKGHIPMAVSIPDSQFEKMTDQLPANKNALLIFYCEGPT
jgi:rhodanese-related sulfurtransferase